ncbi:Com family DNA-binding transcriptional regulator, partial [Pseudomonas canadensis]
MEGRFSKRNLQMLKEFRCGNCKRLLARTGGFTEIQ